jgi:hypothetical protein
MRGQIFKIAMAVVFIFLVWLQSLFTGTEHVIRGDVHIFKYNLVPWLFLVLLSLMLIGFAEIARRFLADRWVAIICLLGIPVFGFISLQFICERVEVSDKLLVHRREPPHTRFNVDIPWDSIKSATKIERERSGLFAPNYYHVGYEFILRNGEMQELPSNTVLTSAQDEIDRMLAARQITVNKRIIQIRQ